MPRRAALSPFARAAADYVAARGLYHVAASPSGDEALAPSSFILHPSSFPPALRVIVALSGGPDSCALLLALCEAADVAILPRPIGAAHFHHGLRGADADADAAFAAALCARLGVPCVIGLGNASPAPGQSPHDAARNARYAFFDEAARDFDANLVATAHTKDDQAETVLMRVLRGTGVDGLAGIPPRRELRNGLAVVRPLLEQTRADVEAYLTECCIEARRDPSNDNARYTRARVRAVLPALAADFNPRLPDALARLAENAASDAALLNTMADELWVKTVYSSKPGGVSLRLVALRGAPAPLRRRVLLRALAFVVQPGDEGDETAPNGRAEDALSRTSLEIVEDVLKANGAHNWQADLPGGLTVMRHDGLDPSISLFSQGWRERAQIQHAKTSYPPVPVGYDYRFPLVVGGAPVQVPPGGEFAQATISAAWRQPDDEPAPRTRGANVIEIAADEWEEAPVPPNDDSGTMAATLDAPPTPRLVVRPARAGERFAPLGMNGKTRRVREMFADANFLWHDGFPWPVVAIENDDGSDGEILWIVGVAQAERTRVTNATRRIIRLQVHWG